MGTHFLTTKAPQPNRYCKYRTVNTCQSYLDPNQKQSKTHNNPSPCQRRRPPREPLRPEPKRRRRTPTRSNEPHTRQRLLKTRSVMKMKRQATMLMPKRKSLPRLKYLFSLSMTFSRHHAP